MASFLKYLESSQGGFRFRFESRPQTPDATGRAADASGLAGLDRDPFTRVLRGDLTADSGSPVAAVTLFLQRDRYLPTATQIRTNPEVSRLWEQAFLHHCRQAGPYAPIILAGQLSPERGFSPFDPLFQCWLQQVYFHPACPECGRPLELCRDDSLLERSGLRSYTASLERYLYCRACADSKDRFTFYRRDPNRAQGSGVSSGGPVDDPGGQGHAGADPMGPVKDCRSLIDEYRRLIGRGDPSGDHPCPKCSRNYECYGPERQAVQRLQPFSFYPFFALAFARIPDGAEHWPPLLEGLPAWGGEPPPVDTFAAGAENRAAPGITQETDAAIYTILDSIQTRWRQRLSSRDPARIPSAPEDSEETLLLEKEAVSAPPATGDWEETLLLLRDEDRLAGPEGEAETLAREGPALDSAEPPVEVEPIPKHRLPAGSAEISDAVTETIVLHTAEPPADVTPIQPPANFGDDEAVETVMLNPLDRKRKSPRPSPGPDRAPPDLEATVAPGEDAAAAPVETPAGRVHPPEFEPMEPLAELPGEESDPLKETMVLGKEAGETAQKRKPSAAPEDLPETVILGDHTERHK